MSELIQVETPRSRSERRSGPARPIGDGDGTPRQRLPPWFRVKLPGGEGYSQLRRLVADLGLHTVCQEAACPNIGECWGQRELTIMILGDTCTRSCGFCDVKTGRPPVHDADEPRRVAEALGRLDLEHAVLTSVDRDELPDLGAGTWAETIRRVRAASPSMTLEVLVPDFRARLDLVDTVLDAGPHVFAHNVETVERLHPRVRPQARYEWTLGVLERAARRGAITKTGLMVGLGETTDEVTAVMKSLAGVGVDILTIGQYLRPSPRHLPVERFVEPGEFDELARRGREMGLGHVEAGPLVRSSYRAGAQARAFLEARGRSLAAPVPSPSDDAQTTHASPPGPGS